ncbi:MAG: lipoprotein signal peptidase [Gammaproteobacteria bacterium]|nr:lipoprotein signal peptidase [Gammaproteobacteria bacterium]
MVIVADQATKGWAAMALAYGQPRAIFPSFNLTLLHNQGAAFSVLATAAGWQRWVLSALALGVSAYLVTVLNSAQTMSRLYRCGLSLILGGALGNLIDRVVHGYVVDFIQVYYDHWYFPAFNLADSAITVGACLLAYEILLGPGASSALANDR